MSGQQFTQGLAGHGTAAGVEQVFLVQFVHHGIDAAGPVEVVHVVMAVGTDVAEVGRGLADLVELLQRQRQPKLIGDSRKVQRCVCGARNGHVHTNGVFKGLLGQDVPGADVIFDQIDNRHARALGKPQAFAVIAGDRAVAGKRHAKGLGQTVHGVCGKHTGAGAAARAAVLCQLLLLLLGHLAGMNLADGLDAGGIVRDIAAVKTGGHGSSGNDDGGNVHTGRRHDCAGHGFVAGDHQHQTINAVRHGHGLNGISDQLAAGQRIHHALMGHGDAVTNGDGGKFHRNAAVHQDALLSRIGNAPQVEVPGNDLVEGVDHTDQRLAPDVFLQMACGVQQASGIGVLHAGKDFFRVEGHGILLPLFMKLPAVQGGGFPPPCTGNFISDSWHPWRL